MVEPRLYSWRMVPKAQRNHRVTEPYWNCERSIHAFCILWSCNKLDAERFHKIWLKLDLEATVPKSCKKKSYNIFSRDYGCGSKKLHPPVSPWACWNRKSPGGSPPPRWSSPPWSILAARKPLLRVCVPVWPSQCSRIKRLTLLDQNPLQSLHASTRSDCRS